MNLLTWNDQLRLGIDSIDRQHQHLIVLINRLDEVIAVGGDAETLVDSMQQLIDYTVYHFGHEEELMQKADYAPDMLAMHCEQHQEFVEQIVQVGAVLKQEAGVVSKEFMAFLVTWFRRHVLHTDKVMAIGLHQGIDISHIKLDEHEHFEILHNNLYSALRESEDRFKELADNLPALIWITNAKNQPIFFNRFWFKTFGIQQGPVNKRQWINTIHPEDRRHVAEAYRNTATELLKHKIQYRLNSVEQGLMWILETTAPRIRQNGAFAGLMGCGVDMTVQKQAEETLERSNQFLEQQVKERTQALLAANQILEFEKNQQTLLNQQLKETQAHLVQSEKMASIGLLAAGVAHEINNPLGYIYSNLHSLQRYIDTLAQITELAELLALQLPADNPHVQALRVLEQGINLNYLKADAAELVMESLEGATRAKRIVQDLRNFSHVDAHELTLFDLEAGLNATLNIVNNEIKYKAQVIKQYGGVQPFACVGSQINQVFMNLLINAAQAIEEAGLISIRTGYQNPEWVWVEIADNGIGMSPEVQSRIFDPFFTTKAVGQGTGLGLSLSYKIIQDHHGMIEVESTPGVGSKFRIILPVHPPA